MTEPGVGARVRVLALTATLSMVLAVSAVVGLAGSVGADDTLPARASLAAGVPDPQRKPAPAVTLTGRPSTQAAAGTHRRAAGLPDERATAAAKVKKTEKPDAEKPAPPKPSVAAEFVLSSFNVLGSSHTRHGARGRASGVSRIRGVARLLARHDVDVVGLQELQSDQARALHRATGGAYSLYPGAGAGKDSDNSIGWRSAAFELVLARTVSIPYFNGHHRSMPLVLLRHRATGVESWFANFHNPAETSRYHHQQRWRTRATILEAELANLLGPAGAPIFITGDMNERAAYFCRLTSATTLVAARGGSNDGTGCRAGGPRAVDWIFGSKGVEFSGYGEDRSSLVDRTTDHPVITSHVRVDAAVFPLSVVKPSR